MATAASVCIGNGGSSTNREGTNTILCRYFLNNCCRKGTACKFSHDRNDRPSQTCRFYLKGECTYGTGCRFDHVKPKQPTPKASVMRVAAAETGSSSSSISSTASTGGGSSSDRSSEAQAFQLRADALEFVPRDWGCSAPGPKSFAAAAGGKETSSVKKPKDLLCPYHITGYCCSTAEECLYTHGDLCDLCLRPCMHPSDRVQNQKHRAECLAEYERDMEESFAIARSADKTCGVCMEVVLEKKGPPSARRFGILQKCNHVFCLECIRKWRQANSLEHKMIRACPHCRTVSDFVTPSSVWIDEEAEKEKLIEDYKKALSAKPCKYFRQGSGECPFGNKCFYRHALADGTIVPGDSPRTIRKRMKKRHHRGNSDEVVREYLLWSFLEDRAEASSSDRETDWLMRMLDLDMDGLSFSDSESDSSFDFWTPHLL